MHLRALVTQSAAASGGKLRRLLVIGHSAVAVEIAVRAGVGQLLWLWKSRRTCGLLSIALVAHLLVAGTPQPNGLPAGWSAVKDANGEEYYWQEATGEVTWDRPTAGGLVSRHL